MARSHEDMLGKRKFLWFGLCLVSGGCLAGMHWVLYPPLKSLYYWWLAPLDAFLLLCAIPLLVFTASGRIGFLLLASVTVLQGVALLYFAVVSMKLPLFLIVSLSLWALRAHFAWLSARSDSSDRMKPHRGCLNHD